MVGGCWVSAVGLSSSASFRDDLLRQLEAAEWQQLVSVSTNGVKGFSRECEYNETVLGHNNQS